VQDDFLRVIDADQAIEEIHGAIMAAVQDLLQSPSR
jgi:hypothetical protein